MTPFRSFLILLILSYNFCVAQTNQSKTFYKPLIFPEPASLQLTQGEFLITPSVTIVKSTDLNSEIEQLVTTALKKSGVIAINTVKKLPKHIDHTFIVLGLMDVQIVQSALLKSNAELDSDTSFCEHSKKESYTLSGVSIGDGELITLAGYDENGLFYAAQTFLQLLRQESVSNLIIHDYPTMAIRGTIEGFYGKPWSMESRKSHLQFLGSVKANTYVYSPKDDPYARDQWREDYPEETIAELGELVQIAQKNHVNFVYAISPGPTICFSDPADLETLKRKFEKLYAIGVKDFYVALDDIEYTKWNCDADKAYYGESGTKSAGIAQSELLNKLQVILDELDPKMNPLIMVPTEYYDAKESVYKNALIENLDPRIVIQWTGTDVVPPRISINDAKQATKAFGRKTLLWDNYPVNDYGQTAGRLLLAPYKFREAGLSQELSGILSNPMNQEMPSRVAVTGVASFGWNDKAYDSDLNWFIAAYNLANGDKTATEALLKLFDTQHLAPTFGSQAWQEQAPNLKALLDKVRKEMAFGDADSRKIVIAELKKYANELRNAPGIIRAVVDPVFIEETEPWLQAMELWGASLVITADGLLAAINGESTANAYFKRAEELANSASEIESIPGATRIGGKIKIADGVLDVFIKDAAEIITM
ncbi:beta-N-acetylhexosaminidase family protein [Plebeiibacterium sediminum]|uniref:Beta-N-acetylglucosaminidase domain-containing protein n=1 Tax=Plebeiibacterium sediminum TaxID=2992112 RepID=A0AAE3M7V9_9BACT|nr:beta-N-acetylglucosaminidase domain-containing protein [Plebeiobacterium sediminum]MCW3788170.1 beta-N-acetylglucosaminidase domain-containing protein [Plebeiobacterium sediminum]